ncbi:MAG: DNA-processing protein DprA [Polyangiaceae bacterium]
MADGWGVEGLRHVTPLEADYPSRLRGLSDAPAPASITVRGGRVEATCAVAVVGSRSALHAAVAFTRELAAAIARAGGTVVSGGALGIDAAAHHGALACGGRTWAVAGTGHEHCFPSDHAELFERIGTGPGAMLWPFPPHFQHRMGFVQRNRVLVALSDAVVVVQAGERSGALNAASWAKRLGKPLWVVPAPPWTHDPEPPVHGGFAGSLQLLAEGARPLTSIRKFLAALGLDDQPDQPEEPASLTGEARDVYEATSTKPAHMDAIATAAGQTAQVAMAALLTLALENVVVEGPPGFFRRTKGCNH